MPGRKSLHKKWKFRTHRSETRPVRYEELNAFVKAADELMMPSIGAAAMIAFHWLQRHRPSRSAALATGAAEQQKARYDAGKCPPPAVTAG